MSKEEVYVIVDKGICTACGSCMCWSPDVFQYDEFSIAENRLDNNTGTVPIPESVLEDVLPTKVCCPVSAIKFSDKPFDGFIPTPEFGTESPDNPNINYEIKEHEWTVNELNAPHVSMGGSCGCGPTSGSSSSCGCGSNNKDSGKCGCGNDSNSCGSGDCNCGDGSDCTC